MYYTEQSHFTWAKRSWWLPVHAVRIRKLTTKRNHNKQVHDVQRQVKSPWRHSGWLHYISLRWKQWSIQIELDCAARSIASWEILRKCYDSVFKFTPLEWKYFKRPWVVSCSPRKMLLVLLLVITVTYQNFGWLAQNKLMTLVWQLVMIAVAYWWVTTTTTV